ncbi:MAG: OmpA family protein [Pyrinomonadaceae bacterium]|nr:OmpA family protein [Sphingobacteriaceae bacterium]
MNYSTIKKVVACSMVTLVSLAATAQETTTATTTSSTAKVFGGRGQYRSWTIGVNAGVLAPVVLTGGTNDYSAWEMSLGYGLTVRKQLGHAFGLEASFLRGHIKGHMEDINDNKIVTLTDNGPRYSFDSKLGANASLMGVANVATVDFLKRENMVNFLIKAGYGVSWFDWSYKASAAGAEVTGKGTYGKDKDNNYIKEQTFPVGLGVKFKLSDRLNFDLGYNMYFTDSDLLDGARTKFPSKDKYSYGYGGLEFSLGSTAKPSLDWVNPVALMYDELKDPTLRQEVEALKTRVSTLENTVNQLSADADGDGVADRFDKCPGTPAGTVVDGSGCPLTHPEASAMVTPAATGSTIQFEFDSSVLRTSAYPILDAISSDLRANSGSKATLEGHASAEGTDSYNMNLSRDRAQSVKTYLVNSGVDANRLSVKAYGESRPVASNETEEGRSQNRRVEVKK